MKLKHLRKNAASNVLGWFVPAVIFIVLTPLMINRLGTDGFGVIALIQVITGYMNVLNFGFSEAIIKQIAESMERDQDQVRRVMWAGLWLFTGFGALGGLVLYLIAEWLGTDLLQIPTALQGDAVTALKIAAAVFLLQMIAEFYRGVALGCQRFDIPNICRILRVSLSGLFIVVALERDGGLAGVMVATLAGLVIGLVVNVWWMERLLPLRKSSGDFRGVLRDLFHFSKHIFFTRLANIVSARMSQFLLGTLSSVANVALYEVPVRAAETASVMLNRILQVLFPGFASMDKTTQAERIRSIFLSVLSLQLLIATPFLVMAVLEGPALLAAWINEDFSRSSSGIITLVAATYFISTLTNLPVFAVMSFGLPQLVSKYSIIRMAITLVLAYPLVKGFGLAGAAWVLLLSELQAFGLIYESAKRLFGMNVYRELARAIFIHAFVGVSLFVVYHWVYRHSALYTPLGVLAIAVLHPVLAIALKATTAADNRRLRNLVLAWQ